MLAQLTRSQTCVDFASHFVDLENQYATAHANSGQLHLCRFSCVKRLNPRRVKIHRSYTVGETAALFGSHKNTVRTWLKTGLQPIDQRRPVLIQGRQLAGFLEMRRDRRKQPCGAGEFYCFRCRMPKVAAAKKADYIPVTAQSGNLRAKCAECGTDMYRRISLHKLAGASSHLQVSLPQAQQRIAECVDPCLNCDLEREPDAQPGK